MHPSEEITWKQIQQKDEHVFERYYKENYKAFYLIAYQYVKDQGLAQEIVNDVFVKIWQDADKIIIEKSLKSYLYRAVINRSINALNKHKKEILDLERLSRVPEEITEFREMETNELKLRLYKAIEALPEQCGRVFRMSRFEGLKQQEIADKLGISIKTVKNHITHALKVLAKSTGISIVLLLVLVKKIFFDG